METTQRVRGEAKVDLGGGVVGSVQAAQKVSPEKVLAAAAEIWTKVGRSGVAADDNAGNDRLFDRLQKEHQEFATSYPIPFRWMVQAREYEPRAFEAFLQKHVKLMYKDRKEFFAAQGEYLVALYKLRNPRAGLRQITRYREAIRETLREDDKAFTEAREEAEAEVKRIDEQSDADRRVRLVQYLRRLKAKREAAGRETTRATPTAASGSCSTSAG